MLAFTAPYFLILIPIILILWYGFFREKIGYIAPNPLIKKYLKTPREIYILWILRWVLISCIVAIPAGLYTTKLEKIVEKQSSHILILLDISRSMLAEDMSPNRLTAAKKTIETFIWERAGDKIGLIVFAGKPFLSLPFSTDAHGIVAFLRNITPDFIHQEKDWLSGTNIGDALLLGNMTLSGLTDSHSIILVTDGRANIGIDPRIALKETSEKNIPVYTIGIGGVAGWELYYTDPTSRQRVSFYDEKWQPLKNDIDEALLEEIATRTHGKYYRAGNTEELSRHLDNINATTAIPDITKIEPRNTRYEPILLMLTFCMLAITYLYTNHIWRKFWLR